MNNMIESSTNHDRANEPEREEKIKLLQTEIGQYIDTNRNEIEAKKLQLALKYLAKYFDYRAEEKLLLNKPSKKVKNESHLKVEVLTIEKKISGLDDDIKYTRDNNPLFKKDYDYLFPKATRLCGLLAVTPQVKASGIPEMKTAEYFRSFVR